MHVMTLDFSISTERLQLFPLQESDIDEIYAALSLHPEICEFLTFDPPSSRKDTEEFVRFTLPRMPKKEMIWTIRLDDGTFVGLAGLHDIERQVLAWKVENANIGYSISPEFHRKGFGTEIGAAVIAQGFGRLGLHKISARYVRENSASAHLLQKLGFEEVGMQKQQFFRNGKWWDCGWMEIVNKNFEQ